MLIKYKDVQNVIAAHFTKLSRKHVDVYRSVELWMRYLREQRNYVAEYVQHPGEGDPFLVYWMSSWQMSVIDYRTLIFFNVYLPFALFRS